MKKRFWIEYVCYSELALEELWPDGDAPEHPTTDDMLALIKRSGGIVAVLNDWCLHDNDGVVDVGELGVVDEASLDSLLSGASEEGSTPRGNR